MSEVILATNPTTTGEATAIHVADRLRGKARITRLASGLPVGADLETRTRSPSAVRSQAGVPWTKRQR